MTFNNAFKRLGFTVISQNISGNFMRKIYLELCYVHVVIPSLWPAGPKFGLGC